MGGGPRRSFKSFLTGSIAAVTLALAGTTAVQAEDAWLRDIRVDEGTGIVAHLHVPFTRFTKKERPRVGVALSSPQYIGTRGDLTKFTWDDSVLINLDMTSSGIEGVNVGGIGASAFEENVRTTFDPKPAPTLKGFTIGSGLEVKPWYGLGLKDEAPPPSPRVNIGE